MQNGFVAAGSRGGGPDASQQRGGADASFIGTPRSRRSRTEMIDRRMKWAEALTGSQRKESTLLFRVHTNTAAGAEILDAKAPESYRSTEEDFQAALLYAPEMHGPRPDHPPQAASSGSRNYLAVAGGSTRARVLPHELVARFSRPAALEERPRGEFRRPPAR